MGDALLFYSLDPDLQINPRSLHGGCPVVKGEVRGPRSPSGSSVG
jgi:hypothetical protein